MDAKTSLERFRNKRKYTASVQGISLGQLVSVDVSGDYHFEGMVEVIEIFGGGQVEITVRQYDDGELEDEMSNVPIHEVHSILSRISPYGETPSPEFPIGTPVQVLDGRATGAVGEVGYMYNRVEHEVVTGWRYVVDFEAGINPDRDTSESIEEEHLRKLSEAEYAAAIGGVSHEIVDEEDILLL